MTNAFKQNINLKKCHKNSMRQFIFRTYSTFYVQEFTTHDFTMILVSWLLRSLLATEANAEKVVCPACESSLGAVKHCF